MRFLPSRSLNSRWLWASLALFLTTGLFVLSTIGWNWYADQQASNARQSSLDLLWIEQTITNKLETHRSILQNWGEDIQSHNDQSHAEFLRRIDALIKENRAILAIEYIDRDQRRVLGLPIYEQRPVQLPPLNDPLIQEALSKAHGLKQASYSNVIEQFAPLWVLVVPLYSESRLLGDVIITYDLDKLLTQEVPWWFVQRYNLNLVDKENKQLSPSDSGTVEHQGDVNRLDFGGIHSGLSLKTSVREKRFAEWLLPSLGLAVVVFGALIAWLLHVLRRWFQERSRARQALRERDELLQHTARLSSLAEFASGIAHELNQPLAAIANYSAAIESFMNTPEPPWPKIEHALKKMGEESRRAGKIMHSMRNFIHKHSAPFELRELHHLLIDAIELVQDLARRNHIGIEIKQECAAMPIECDPEMLKQVFFNLLRNAIEAMAGIGLGGNITCVLQEDETAYIIQILDSGPGLSEPDKLFQAFYTSKADGMGLGLAICRTVVENHGGRITANNYTDPTLDNTKENTGASFTIRLPKTTAPLVPSGVLSVAISN
ncbi:sensor histidine kinase [Undibacterium sp. LX40W]|uniref:histidine kinase n=1 Tax=Undibacterium nitidum TaxID=2762298 RepID=A0A923KQQ3_9BURK|nr:MULTISPECIES: HAMP domain-containing sensor histidine kinase [Undibacterium]MBC3883203.1 sensor histidine kinase [Undibacterium nitidum]MBC3893485.1 sensor histidine kinase [Undibacterium sp. LX40W]